MRHRLVAIALLMAAPTSLAVLARADVAVLQSMSMITGVVSDVQGGVIPGATVTVRPAVAAGPTRQIVTNAQGRYELSDVAPGRYRVEVRMAGFAFHSAEVVVPRLGQAEWNVALRLARPTSEPEPVDSFVGRLVGPQARDCGRHENADTRLALETSLRCAVVASRQRQSFHTIVQYDGVDSHVAWGLIGSADVPLSLFHYDSAPCGGSGCPPRFAVTPCSAPQVVASPDGGAPYRYDCTTTTARR